MAASVKVKMVRSAIGAPRAQRESLRGLGLNRINDERELTDSPALRGMIACVSHLVTVAAGSAGAKRPRAAKAAPKK